MEGAMMGRSVDFGPHGERITARQQYDNHLKRLPWTFQEMQTGDEPTIQFRTKSVGPAYVVDCVMDRAVATRSRSEVAETGDNWIAASLTMSGHRTVTHSGRDAECEPGTLLLWQTAKPLACVVSDRVMKKTFFVPSDYARVRCPDIEDFLGQSISADNESVKLMCDFARSGVLDASDRAELEITIFNVIMELIIGVVRSESHYDESGNESEERFRQILDYIHEHACDPSLSSVRMARQHNMSLRSLQQVFAMHGTSVAAYLRRYRLQRCYEDLLRGDGTVTDVAFRNGFADASHFSRVFKAHFGHSPRDTRRVS
jgi:AraC family transcriptional activator of tynA and feaB